MKREQDRLVSPHRDRESGRILFGGQHGQPVPTAGDAPRGLGWLGVAIVTGIVLLCVLALNGCSGLQGSYVDADRLTYKAVAPVYLRYTEADLELDDRAKKRRRRLVRSWDGRLKEGEKSAK